MLKQILLFIVLILLAGQVWSQPKPQGDYSKDTVWTNEIADQPMGFFNVKFSLTDSLIVAHGYSQALFIDAKTGREIHRIDGSNEVFFINNDNNFIRLNQARTKFEIFDTKSFLVIDSLESDGVIVNEYPIVDMSKDEKYLVAPIPSGFRIWDLMNKKILKTKIFPQEPNLINVGIDNPRFIQNSNNILAQFSKTYRNPNYPYNLTTWGDFTVYNINTLDSIDSFGNHRGFVLSKTGKYIVYVSGYPNIGIEIYDFNTKQLLKKIALNSLNLTGIEFSPDDKYIVTSAGPDDNYLKIWNIDSGKEVYSYVTGGYERIDLSNNGQFLVTSVGRYLFLYKTNYVGTYVQENIDTIEQILYPNPTTGKTSIQFAQPFPEITNLMLYDMNGRQIKNLFSSYLEAGNKNIDIDASQISQGIYLINVQNQHLSLMFKLIINK